MQTAFRLKYPSGSIVSGIAPFGTAMPASSPAVLAKPPLPYVPLRPGPVRSPRGYQLKVRNVN